MWPLRVAHTRAHHAITVSGAEREARVRNRPTIPTGAQTRNTHQLTHVAHVLYYRRRFRRILFYNSELSVDTHRSAGVESRLNCWVELSPWWMLEWET